MLSLVSSLTMCCFVSFRYCCDKLRLVPGILCWEHFVAYFHRLLSLHHLLRVQRWVLCTFKYTASEFYIIKKQHFFEQIVCRYSNMTWYDTCSADLLSVNPGLLFSQLYRSWKTQWCCSTPLLCSALSTSSPSLWAGTSLRVSAGFTSTGSSRATKQQIHLQLLSVNMRFRGTWLLVDSQ